MAKPNPKPRDPSPWKSKECPGGFTQLCRDLWAYGDELETWGNAVLAELDAIKAAAAGGGTGTPPTDATQPPPPPFKKP